ANPRETAHSSVRSSSTFRLCPDRCTASAEIKTNAPTRPHGCYTRRSHMVVASAGLLVLAALQASAAAGSPATAHQASSASVSPQPATEQVPVSLSRIRRGLERQSELLKPVEPEATQ